MGRCLGVCGFSFGLGAAVMLAVAIALGTDYNQINDVVKHQIDEVKFYIEHRARLLTAPLSLALSPSP